MSITIGVANQKGGVGKTSTTIELATILGKKSQVLVIDFDQQGNASEYAGADMSYNSIYDALHSLKSIEECIQHTDYFDVIISSEELSKADRQFVDADDIYLLLDLIEILRDKYDFFIIDGNPGRNVLLSMLYVCSDYILIPTECDKGSLKGVQAVYEDVLKLRKVPRGGGESPSHAKIAGILLTKYEKTILHQEAMEVLQDMVEEMEDNPFVLPVRKSIVASEAKTMGAPIQIYAKNSTTATDYRKVAQTLKKAMGV